MDRPHATRLGSWGLTLKDHLEQQRPTQYKQMSEAGTLEAFLLARQERAVERYDQLIRENMQPDQARQQALSELLDLD